MDINLIDTDKVIAYANNPRKNPAIDKVAASIKEFGFRQPIVVDEEMVVIVGHTRLLAAKKLNIKQDPVHIAAGLTKKQAAAYRLADNRVQEAEWDDSKLVLEFKELEGMFTGFDKIEIKTLLAQQNKYNKDPEESPEPPIKPISQPGDMYILGDHKVICGDSTDPAVYDKLLGDERVDLVLTDPPYGVAYTTVGSHNTARPLHTDHRPIANDNLEQGQFNEFLKVVFKNTVDKMKPGAALYVFHADVQRDAFQRAMDANNIHLTVSLVWVKNSLVMSRMDYQPRHEPCLYGWKEGAAHYFALDRSLTTVIDDEPDYAKLPKEQLVQMLKAQMIVKGLNNVFTSLINLSLTQRLSKMNNETYCIHCECDDCACLYCEECGVMVSDGTTEYPVFIVRETVVCEQCQYYFSLEMN